MATEKAPNFTVEQVDRLREVYGASVEANDDYDARKVVVESLAAEFDKKPNSIIVIRSSGFSLKKGTSSLSILIP